MVRGLTKCQGTGRRIEEAMSSKHSRVAFVLAGAVLAVTGLSAHAASIDAIAGNLGDTLVFNNGEWDMQSAPFADGSVVGDDNSVWFIAPSGFSLPAEFTWTGNALDPPDLSTNGLADGMFLGGGTLSITGQLFNNFFVPVFDGLLLEGTVSAFRMTESGPNTNFVNMNINDQIVTTFTPTAGYLLGNTPMELSPVPYIMSYSAQDLMQNGGPLEDWNEPPVRAAVGSWDMTIPEPATLTLLGSMMLLVAPRRRNRS